MTTLRVLAVLCLGGLMFAREARAQVVLTPGGSVTQNFDGIGASATATLPSGWRISNPSVARSTGSYSAGLTATTVRGGNNMSSTAGHGRYNFGAGNATTAVDRAVGFLASGGGTDSGNLFLALTNTSASAISNLVVTYDVEKYRNSNNGTNFVFQLYVSSTGSNWTSAGASFQSVFPPDGNANGFTNAPGLTVAVSNSLAVTLPASGALYLNWHYSVIGGSSVSFAPALGIDNVVISAAVAQPFLTVVPAASTVGEDDTNGVVVAVVLSEVLGTDLTLDLAAAPGGVVTLSTNSLTFLAGTTNGEFTAFPVYDPVSFTNASVTLSATGSNVTAGSALLTVTNIDVPVTGLVYVTVSPDVVFENDTNGITGSVILSNPPPTNGLAVTLAAAPGAWVVLSTNLFVFGEGVTNLPFTAVPVPDPGTELTRTIDFTASGTNFPSGGVSTLTISNYVAGYVSVVLDAASVLENDTNGVTGQVFLDALPPTGGVTVNLSAAASVVTLSTNSLAFPEGVTNLPIVVYPVYDPVALTNTFTVVSGSGLYFQPGAVTPESTLEVVNVDTFGTMALDLTPTPIAENDTNGVTGTITLSTNAPPAGLTVSVTTSPTNRVTPFTTNVFIPANATSATFTLLPVWFTNVYTNFGPVTVVASGLNFGAATNSLSITNVDVIVTTVVVNKYYNSGILNGTGDAVELLVIGTNAPGSTVSLSGMVVKDFSSDMANDNGGKYRFTNAAAVWSSVPAGTLVVLSANTNALDTNTPWVIRAGLKNTNLFTDVTGGNIFDIATTDFVAIKAAGSSTAGTSGALHSLGSGNAGALFTGAPVPKLRGSAITGSNLFAYAVNPNGTNGPSSIGDFDGTNALSGVSTNLAGASLVLGEPNNTNNALYILWLRGTNAVPPVGPYDSYMTSFGLTGADAAPGFDFDGDGVVNLLEYAFSSNPALESSQGGAVVGTDAGFLTITVPRNSNASDIVYYVDAGTNLTGWSVLTNFTGVDPAPAGSTLVITNNPLGTFPAEFLRVRVEKP